MNISVIIPTLNEAAALDACLPAASDDIEVIVADGCSRDGTAELAVARGCKVCLATPGRARQMNAGAEIASGNVFLFLHADTRLPKEFAAGVRSVLAEQNNIAGAFRLQIDSSMRGIRLVETLANWRATRFQMPYGDQAIFLRAADFWAIGGFPDLPIMEDVELIWQLRKHGRIGIAAVPVITSARRWEQRGVWKTTLINQACRAAHCLGVPPARIHGWYYGAEIPRVNFKVSACGVKHIRGSR